jgi:peptide/nickel transport system permease protein
VALFAAIAAYGIRVARHDNLRATWRRVLRDAAGACARPGAGAVRGGHAARQRALPPCAAVHRPARPAGKVFYDTRTESLLDLVLARPIGMRETTYSAPLAYLAITKQRQRDGQTVRELPRLATAAPT